MSSGNDAPQTVREALKPCPFCGGEAKRITIEEEGDNFGGDVIVCTGICGASSHVEFGRKENLVSLWNSRANPSTAGVVLVLREPTEAMRVAIADFVNDTQDYEPDRFFDGIWSAALAASPPMADKTDRSPAGGDVREARLREALRKIANVRPIGGHCHANSCCSVMEGIAVAALTQDTAGDPS